MKLLNISGPVLPNFIFESNNRIHRTLMILFLIILVLCISSELYAGPVDKKKKSVNWFWCLYEHTEDINAATVVYRPFYMEAVHNENLFQASLLPVIFWRYKNNKNDVTKGFFGLYESTDYKHQDEKKDYDNGLFPLFLYGSGDSGKDNYLFIYPLGGNIRGKFAYDRISPYVFPGVALFFLFPPSGIFTWQTFFYSMAALIPVYTGFEDKDYTGTALFWPFVSWGKGSKREDFRILPFYAHNSKTGWYDNYQYLFLINYRELYLSHDERYTFFFLPFFGKKWSKSGRMKSYTVIWPFFSWGYDLDKNEKIYNLPWPLIQIGDSDKPKMKKRIFFPFYGAYETSTYESMFITPLYFRIKKDADYYKSEYHIICIIAWYLKRDYLKPHEYYGRSWRYFKLWPLVQVEWSDSGLYSINLLSLLPFRDTEGYEKLYQPFWTLFEYRKKPDGEKHLGILLRTYYQVWNDDFFKMKVPVVVNFESRGNSIKEFTLLFSSFGYEKNEEGTYIKLLWFPVKIGEGDADFAENINTDPDMDISFMREKYGFNPCHANLACDSLQDNFYFKINFKM